MARRIWVERLLISPATAQKIRESHSLDPDEVRDAVEQVEGLRGKWDIHPQRGSRALLHVHIGGERRLVVLYPVATPDVYAPGSAYTH